MAARTVSYETAGAPWVKLIGTPKSIIDGQSTDWREFTRSLRVFTAISSPAVGDLDEDGRADVDWQVTETNAVLGVSR